MNREIQPSAAGAPAPRNPFVANVSPGAGAYAPAPPVPYLEILGRNKWLLGLCVAFGFVAGALIAWRLPNIYQARELLEVQGVNEHLLNRQELDPSARADNSSQSYINTEAKLLQSSVLFYRVAQKLNESGRPQDGAKWNPPITKREIASDVRVLPHDTDRIIEVNVESRDPQRAAAIANSIGTEFIKQDLESRWQDGKNTSEWLARELADLAAKLRASEDELQAFTKRSNLLMDDGQGSVEEGRLRDIQEQLARAEDDRIARESVFENTKHGAQSAPITDSTAEQYQVQLTALGKQLAEMQAVYAPGYYKIAPLKAQIASIEKALAEQRHVALAKVESDYRAAMRREALLRNQYQQQFNNTANESAKMVRFESLKKAVATNRTIYEEMLQKVKGYGVAAAMQASNVRVADPAEVPRTPKRPNRPMIVILSALGFLCAGMVWSLAKAAGNHSITKPGEAHQFLNLPELGVIPAAFAEMSEGWRSRIAKGKLALRGGSAMVRPVETITWKSSPSLMAESFRSTSASLMLPWKRADRGRVMLVTSMTPSEGKTTVASNIGISMAATAGRVLLIDADRRRPRLHNVFEKSNKSGLGEFILSDEPIKKAGAYIVPTQVPNLFLLPNGTAMLDRPDLLYSSRMAELIDFCRGNYDVVLIDTPPFLHLSDARVLGRLSDGVILVLRAGRVRWDSIAAAERRLSEDGTPILGTVLNNWQPGKDGFGVYPSNKDSYSYIAS